jgi:hypothetical protein
VTSTAALDVSGLLPQALNKETMEMKVGSDCLRRSLFKNGL